MSLPASGEPDNTSSSPFPSLATHDYDSSFPPHDTRHFGVRRSSDLEMSRLNHNSGRDEHDQEQRWNSPQQNADKPSDSRQRAGSLLDPELDMTLSSTNLANKAFVRKVSINVVLILLWYAL